MLTPLVASAWAVLAAACGPAGVPHTALREQVLSASVDSGASAVDAPRGNMGYKATFGAFILCSRRPGVVPEIEGVTPQPGSPAPISFHAVLRLVTGRYVSRHPDDTTSEFAPIGFTLGSPPDFSESYAGLPAPGWYRPVEGYRVSTGCRDAKQAVGNVGPETGPRYSIAELMVVLTSGPSGGVVRSFTIDYRVGSRQYHLPVHWEVANCGSAVKGLFCGG
jgi:hypothetical protein